MRIELGGYGAEIIAGSLTEEQWSFWKSATTKEIYSHLMFGEDFNVPESCLLGSWDEVADLCRATGPDYEDVYMRVVDDGGSLIWEGDLESLIPDMDIDDLHDSGITSEANDFYFGWYFRVGNGSSYGLYGYHRQKGLFETYELKGVNDWDPKKLRLEYVDIEENAVVTDVYYDGRKMEALGDISTDSKHIEFRVLSKFDYEQ